MAAKLHLYKEKKSIFTYIEVNYKCNSRLNFSEMMESLWYWVLQNPVVGTNRKNNKSQHNS